METYQPNPRLCRMAARLWREKMEAPEFNQLGRPRCGSADEVLAEMFSQVLTMKITAGTSARQLDRFEEELTTLLLTPYPFRGRGESAYLDTLEWVSSLSTDYGPDFFLASAGERAGLPEAQFPIKSTMQLGRGHLCAAFGYGEMLRYYYPLPNARWLVTSLHGAPEDVETLLGLAEHFTVIEGP